MLPITLSPQQIADYQRDGVIILRGVFRDWIDTLRDGFEIGRAHV